MVMNSSIITDAVQKKTTFMSVRTVGSDSVPFVQNTGESGTFDYGDKMFESVSMSKINSTTS